MKIQPQIALNEWASACDKIGVAWYVYQETLLCLNGYHRFPKELNGVQIAVKARDLPDIVEMVVPQLPSEWELDISSFVRKTGVLHIKNGEDVIMSISILYGVDDCNQMDELSQRLFQIRSFSLPMHILLFLRYRMKRFMCKPVVEMMNCCIKKKFSSLLELASTSNDKKAYYCDAFTNAHCALMERSMFSNTTMIDCQSQIEFEPLNNMADDNQLIKPTVSYPTFSGYRDYLEITYGDYEKGLFDEIGVGLSVNEKDELKIHQSKCIEALAFLQDLSKEYNLRYYLIAGSVLGAVRHGGFIPWDDDVDIGVRIEELDEFERKVKENLPKQFTLEQSAANNSYPRMFSKICYNGRCCIDIWPLIPTYLEGKKAVYQWYFGKIITKSHYSKIGHKVLKFNRIAKLIGFFFSDRAIIHMAKLNERRYFGKNTPAYINLYSIYRRDKETIRRSWLDDDATAIFEGIEVPIVGCTKAYLTHLYGDFMSYPPPWKRVSRHVSRFGN